LAQTGQPIEIIQIGRKNEIQRGEILMINPEIALKAGVQEGQEAQVIDASGNSLVKGTIQLSNQAHYGTVSQTTLFGELATLLDNSEHYDPMNRVPRLRVVPVRLEALKI
jgi:anaerobic selenocysteine-containing dehydrogenase